MSRPARALWIEMDQRIHLRVSSPRRGPRGPCGLKSTGTQEPAIQEGSRPARALWIEILQHYHNAKLRPVEAREGLVD